MKEETGRNEDIYKETKKKTKKKTSMCHDQFSQSNDV